MAKRFSIVNGALEIYDTIELKNDFVLPVKKLWYKEQQLQDGAIELYNIDSPANTRRAITPVMLSDSIDKYGVVFTEETFRQFAELYFSNTTLSAPVNLATNDLGRDAWGRPKTINDFTLFGALWTFNVPSRQWVHYNAPKTPGYPYLEVPGAIPTDNSNKYVSSKNGYLSVVSDGTNSTHIQSKRHIRYQPNKGYLYSSAHILPNPTQIGFREFGLNNGQSGVYFKVEGDGTNTKIYACKTTTINGVKDRQQTEITSYFPDGFDVSKGHVYDIQMQWRGVGNFMFYVDLKLIYTMAMLGTLTAMSVNNPALNVGYSCYGAEADLELITGCVDVTSEGGHKSNKLYTSINTGKVLLPTTNDGKAIIAMRLPITISYNGQSVNYTRDMILTELSTFCKDEAIRIVHFGRLVNTPNLLALTGWTIGSDSFYEWKTNEDGTLDTAFQLDKANVKSIYATRQEKDFSISHKNPSPEDSDFNLSAGDILILELQSDGNSIGGGTFEFAEEV